MIHVIVNDIFINVIEIQVIVNENKIIVIEIGVTTIVFNISANEIIKNIFYIYNDNNVTNEYKNAHYTDYKSTDE